MQKRLKKNKFNASAFHTGANLLEVVIALVLLGVIIAAFGTIFLAFRLANEASYRNMASAIAEAGLDALRSADPAIISNQTDSPFLGTLINHGAWSVFATSTAPSGSQALIETSSSPTSGNISGLLLLNSKSVATSTVEAYVLWAPENSASGTAKAGILIRNTDTTHGYFYSIGPESIELEKRNGGTKTTLFSQSGSYSQGVWHKLKIIASGTNFSLYYNDLLIGSASDTIFTEGDLAIFSEYALLGADSITISGDINQNWNFDSDTAGSLPKNLKRLGFGDIPRGRGTLTISDAYPGYTDLKKATIKVYWLSPQGEKNVEATTLLKM